MHDKLHDDGMPLPAPQVRLAPASESVAMYPLEPPREEQTGVPRRFGIGVLMIMTAAFAAVCGVLQSLGMSAEVGPLVIGTVGVLLFGVSVGQVLLFRSKNPRLASVIVGSLLFPIEILAVLFLLDSSGLEFFGFAALAVLAGPLAGYLAGGLTAGLFLILNRFSGSDSSGERRPTLTRQPLEENDLPALLVWIESEPLRKRIAPEYEEALSAASLRTDLVLAVDPDAPRRLLKLVDASSAAMVGCAQIVDIDRTARAARLRFAVVDPNVDDRGWVSAQLLKAIKQFAFDELGLDELRVRVMNEDAHGLVAYRAADFATEPAADGADQPAAPPLDYRTLRAVSSK